MWRHQFHSLLKLRTLPHFYFVCFILFCSLELSIHRALLEHPTAGHVVCSPSAFTNVQKSVNMRLLINHVCTHSAEHCLSKWVKSSQCQLHLRQSDCWSAISLKDMNNTFSRNMRWWNPWKIRDRLKVHGHWTKRRKHRFIIDPSCHSLHEYNVPRFLDSHWHYSW